MRILTSVASLHPSYGGPAHSVSRLSIALEQAGVDVGLWTMDGSVMNSPLLPSTSRIDRLVGTEAAALNAFGKTDIVHDNGLWLLHNHRLAQLAKKCGIGRVVSTRGMLEPWAIKHKACKKTLAWWAYQRQDLRCAQRHHATSQPEADNLQKLGLGASICMIPNGVDVPNSSAYRRSLELKRKIKNRMKVAVFMGRIYPVKGLPMLIEAWSKLRPVGWLLKIAGADEAGHQAEVERLVSAAELRNSVSFLGQVSGRCKQSLLFSADFLVLPTHSESFGIVVAEALAHGIPVLTTTGAPWKLLEDRNCGWWVKPTVEGITEGVRSATCCDTEALVAMGSRGRDFVSAELGWDHVVRRFIAAYEDVLRERC
jgi:glycosyltransferase involved in cell wall biosynthesis